MKLMKYNYAFTQRDLTTAVTLSQAQASSLNIGDEQFVSDTVYGDFSLPANSNG